MKRLSQATLGDLPAGVERPGYDRAGLGRGVVHLGVGAFHRAHQAVVFDDLIRRGDTRWGITGASLRSPAVRAQLRPQDGLYTVLVRDAGGTQARVIGALGAVLTAPEDPAALVAALAAPATGIVTLTITEKGYLLDPASGGLIADDPQVTADRASLAAPQTAAGFLTAALALRRDRGLAPFTAISCDNLPGNGARLRGAVLAMAAAHDPRLRDWIAERVCFPQTMVDRIVPATADADIAAWAETSDLEDRALVKTEPFSQWVIEDRFAGPRPDFEAVGVQMTAEVAPWEAAKLRLLNGAHSAIAYLGGLAGIEFVHEFVGLAEGGAFVERLWDEAAPTLEPPPGLDVPAYRVQLMARFANPALMHRTRQIAMDGSQKLPQRLLATMADRLDGGQPIAALALAVAAWMRWQRGRDEAGRTFAVDDPLASTTARLAAGARSPAETVAALSSLAAIFPPRLAADPAFAEAVTRQLERLVRQGVRGVLAAGA